MLRAFASGDLQNMSKIGKQLIKIPEGVDVKIIDGKIEVKGKLGSLSLPILEYVTAKLENGELYFVINASHKQARSNWGTMRALSANAVKGVAEGYNEVLEIEGIGFKANLEGQNLVLTVGFSHPVKYEIPVGASVVVEKNTIKINGIDKQLVGEVAAEIRAIKKTEPYKGTGIKYKGEVIRRKAGKKVAGAGAAA